MRFHIYAITCMFLDSILNVAPYRLKHSGLFHIFYTFNRMAETLYFTCLQRLLKISHSKSKLFSSVIYKLKLGSNSLLS